MALWQVSRWVVVLTIVTTGTALLSGIAVAGAQTCASVTPISGPDGYRPRHNGERCEGLYENAPRSSGPRLELLSLTRGRLAFDPVNPTVLQIRLATSASIAAHVQAVGIQPGLYYRLDADLGPGQSVRWPVAEVLGHLNIGAQAVGVYATIPGPLNDPRTYVPVEAIAAGAAVPARSPIIAILRPLDHAVGLKWRFTPRGQVASGAWRPAAAHSFTVELTLSAGEALPPGQLDVTWPASETGMPQFDSFTIGP